MNKLLLICLLLISMSSFSQPQYKNSLKDLRESYIQTGREMRAETKKIKCEEIKLTLEESRNSYISARNEENKLIALFHLSKMSCPQIISFFEEVIKNDTSELIRCEAIKYLGWIDAQSSIKFLLNRADSNTEISNYEKVCIGTTLSVLEDYKDAENILNKNCFTLEQKYCDRCIWAYYIIGNNSSINYYRYLINNSKDDINVNIAVQKLAELGDIETAYPVMEKIMNEDNAIKGGIMRILKAIGDQRSIQLIEKVALNDKSEDNRKFAKKLLETNINR